MSFPRIAPPRSLVALALLGILFALGGCGTKVGSVSGKVTYQGKALPSGTVTFLAPNNKVVSSPINSDGTYSAENVPVGKAKITVTTTAKPPAPKGKKGPGMMMMGEVGKEPPKMDPGKMDAPSGAKSAAPDAVPAVYIPSKYGSPETSNLTYEVKQGSNENDIKLD